MAKKADTRTRIVDAAMRLAAERGWRRLSMIDIAEAAKLPLAELYAHTRSKAAIAATISTLADEAVLAGAGRFGPEDSPRDRLFDAMMRRFDALAPYRDGLAAVVRDRTTAPVAALCMGTRLLTSMAWTLEAAEIPTGGLWGRLRVKGAAAIYLSVLPVWFRDDSEDRGRTMAALDRRLDRAERIAATLWRGRRTTDAAPPPEPPAAPAPAG